MKIIYNPPAPKGSIIKGWNLDGTEYPEHEVGKLVQYNDDVADSLLETFEFLEEVDAQRAENLLNKPKKKKYQCEYCEFSTDHKIALAGHTSKHKEEIKKKNEPKIDVSKVPVAEGKKKQVKIERDDSDILEGSGWYGEGMKESFGAMPPEGKGHFKANL